VDNKSTHKIGTFTAFAIVVANMIGTGVFTSLGFQLKNISNPSAVLSLWVLGGLLALSGAFSYVEIGTIIKKSGGEYRFLTELFSPIIGYLAGWISLTVGFAAPIALASIAVVEYFPYSHLNPVISSILIVGIITLVHSINLKSSSIFQNTSTILKLILIVSLILIGIIKSSDFQIITNNTNFIYDFISPAFAIALIYVSYSYSGWNAAVYITDELENPKKSLFTALVGGTAIVTIIYTLLQYIFLKHVPITELVGQTDVGAIAAKKMLGDRIGNLFSLAISLLLVSSISAMVWVGPRVTSAMAKDHPIWSYFRTSKNGIPIRALWFQFLLTAILLLTGTFEQILIYCGFLLTLSSMLTVLGVFKLRRNKPDINKNENTFKSPLFPLFQLIYVAFSIFMIIFAIVEKPLETAFGLSNLLLGVLTWFIDLKLKKAHNE